jgi:hypothetical protein
MFRAFSLLFLAGISMQGVAQAPAGAASPLSKPSELVQPAIDNVAKTGSSVDLNRWKGSNTMRAEVDSNLASVQKDLQGTLPPLLAAADAAPLSASASMPVLLNMDALYNVLLRISINGNMAAPRDQAEALNGSLATLDGARRDLAERITKLAASQEKQLSVLQTTIQQQAAALTAAQQTIAGTNPATTTAPKPKKKKPAAKPAPPAAAQ